jgi:hypothetical protein
MSVTRELEALLGRMQQLESPDCRTAGFVVALAQLRAWQAARLARTYRDFQGDPRYGQALEFFLSDLYGPQEFAERNRDLRRAWVYLKRTLPASMIKVLRQAIELDVLTLELDHAMVRALGAEALDDAAYAMAYRTVGELESRTRQIELIVGIGADLARMVKRVWLGALLKTAHVPAHAAGFGVLQDFLERGYAAFRRMQGAARLLQAIEERETRFMRGLLAGEPVHG